MGTWSESHFLHALGWATLNSFWQMAILWCVFAGVNHVFKLSATKKYQAAVAAMFIGFAWFITSFILYYQSHSGTSALFENTIVDSDNFLHILLLSASLTYLLLLIFPAVRLFKNWQFVQVIKNEGLAKADLNYRVFVQKISFHLGISKKVQVVVSSLVSSPLTVGYLKPLILLPVAALNQLTTVQVEAILLHELSHIRRYDYLINLIVSFIHTLLYFNPFAKLFMNAIEAERENCCDELVLQFGYDKVGYASALLHLEKSSDRYKALALAAAGKQNLLNRIEKIVGMEKKKTFRLIQIVPLFAAMLCVLLFNSVLIIKDAKSNTVMSYNNETVLTPWQWNPTAEPDNSGLVPAERNSLAAFRKSLSTEPNSQIQIDIFNTPVAEENTTTLNATLPVIEHLLPVNFDDIDGRLTSEEKENVTATMQATKKVATQLQWNEIEKSLCEVMTKKEIANARHEYFEEVAKVDWKAVEQNLKANYDRLNWEHINANVDRAMAQVTLDSLHTIYSTAAVELAKLQKELATKAKLKRVVMPDCSLQEIEAAKQILAKKLEAVKAARPKKIVEL